MRHRPPSWILFALVALVSLLTLSLTTTLDTGTVVRAGIASPWMESAGGGIQYLLPARVSDLIDAGYLRAVGP